MPAIDLTPAGSTSEPHSYSPEEWTGVLFNTIAGSVSLFTVLGTLFIALPRTTIWKRTHILGYFVSLLLSNVIQSAGTVMNAEWLKESAVRRAPICVAQAAIKHLGNVGNAMWTLAIALHLFNILFLRWTSRKFGFLFTLLAGWTCLFSIVLFGPVVLEKHQPYLGISGSWCWITPAYPTAQRFLEYFFEYLSAGVSFVLYIVILLRVRGNLIIVPDAQDSKASKSSICRVRFRFVPLGESWRLSLLRDFIDNSMIRVVHQMMWYPVAYTVLIVPVGIARLSNPVDVPNWAILLTGVIYNLTGFVNVVLLYATHRVFPPMKYLPPIKPRKTVDMAMFARHGVTPFIFVIDPPTPDTPEFKTASTEQEEEKNSQDEEEESQEEETYESTAPILQRPKPTLSLLTPKTIRQ